MVPRLVPEISSLDAFCDGGAGIGDSRSLMLLLLIPHLCYLAGFSVDKACEGGEYERCRSLH